MDDLLRTSLCHRLRTCGSVLVAASGGVDSSVVMALAHQTPGLRVCAASVATPLTLPDRIAAAGALARRLGIRWQQLRLDHLLDDPAIGANTRRRCYHCKKMIMHALLEQAKHTRCAVVVDGTTADDLTRHRPGLQALQELGIRSPLAEAGVSKPQVRSLATQLNLTLHDLPADTCLATRVPYDTPLTSTVLQQVARVETLLHELGFSLVRARHHGDTVRIELDPAAIARATNAGLRRQIIDGCRAAGFRFVTIDLAGYHSGCFD